MKNEESKNVMLAVRKDLTLMEPEFQKVLPPDVTPARFVRVVLTAVQQNNDLLNANRQTLISSCMRCAQDGLTPDGKEAALVAYGKDVNYLPMIRGVVKKAYQGGEIVKWSLRTVHAKDVFKVQYGDDEKIIHEPALSDRGELTGAYSIAVLKNGQTSREYMSKDEIEKVRQCSKMRNSGPWRDHYEEMCKKTVGHRHAKRLPMTPGLESVLEALESHYDFNNAQIPPPVKMDWLPGVEPRSTAESFVRNLKGTVGGLGIVAQMIHSYRTNNLEKYADQLLQEAEKQGMKFEGPVHDGAPPVSAVPESERLPFEREPGDE